jgi:hypothetical protein
MVDYILQRSDIPLDEFMRSLPERELYAIIRRNLEVMRPILPKKTGRLQASLNATIFNDRIMVYIPSRIYYAQYVNEKPATMGYFDRAYETAFKPGFLSDIANKRILKATQKAAALAAAAAVLTRRNNP